MGSLDTWATPDMYAMFDSVSSGGRDTHATLDRPLCSPLPGSRGRGSAGFLLILLATPTCTAPRSRPLRSSAWGE